MTDTHKKFVKGDPVRLSLNPGRVGVCTGVVRPRGSHIFYQVKFSDGTTDFVAGSELELSIEQNLDDYYSLIREGRYGRAVDLRRNLTYVHLSGRLANLVYSMGITNTDFYPHQYKPLLTLLESPANGLLIADEVGLGKTIEAGIIWTELRARYDMRRLLIVCPAMLREKWKDELARRFGINADVVGATELLDELKKPRSSTGDGKAWVVSYQSIRPPKEWRRSRSNDGRKLSARWQLADYFYENAENEKLLDLVIFDEAHYMRNQESAAFTLGELIRDAADFVVLLSATPINLRNDDLYNLLRLADPEHFQSIWDFEQMLEANQPLVQARDLALKSNSSTEDILECLSRAATQPLLEESLQLKYWLKNPPTTVDLQKKGFRAQLAESLERINLMGHVVSRTRKRDIHLHRPKRDVQRECVPMTDIETLFYQTVTDLTREYAWKRGISDGFLLATPQRQVSSCPAAMLRAWGGADQAWLDDLTEDYEFELEDEDFDTSISLKEYVRTRLPREITLEKLEKNDSKFDRLASVIGSYLDDQTQEKIIVFTSYRTTASYLVDRLNQIGIQTILIWGNMSQTKQDIIDEFRDSAKLKVLVSTEVAAEGVDLQFCRVLVNYDLPWNPMKVEQRIGRIDRLGQKSDLLHVWNLYFEGTIDDRIVHRLLYRLRIFEEALGTPEPVVGATITRLEAELLTRPLTEDEENARIEQAAQAIENLRQVQNQLEEGAAQMIAHGGLLLEKITSAQEFSRRVTEQDLFIYIRDFLLNRAPGHRFEQDANDPLEVDIQLPPFLAAQLDEFLRKKQLLGQTHLSTGSARRCRFLNKVNVDRRSKQELINQFHPLVRFVNKKLRDQKEHFYPIVAIALRSIEGTTLSLPSGNYVFCVKKWIFEGIREEELLVSSALELSSNLALDRDAADMLVNAARLHGADWLNVSAEVDNDAVDSAVFTLEGYLDSEFEETLQRKKNENSDRARFQLYALQQHLERKVPKLKEQVSRYLAEGRQGLAKMAQGKINKLEAKCETQRERIKLREQVKPAKNFVCAGVIRIH